MATHVGIIHKGKLLFQGTLSQLQSMKQQQSFLQIDTSNNESALQILNGSGARHLNGYITIPYKSKEVTAAINRKLVEHNLEVYSLHPQQSDLEQLFIDITSNNN